MCVVVVVLCIGGDVSACDTKGKVKRRRFSLDQRNLAVRVGIDKKLSTSCDAPNLSVASKNNFCIRANQQDLHIQVV